MLLGSDLLIAGAAGNGAEFVNKLHKQNKIQTTTVNDITGWATYGTGLLISQGNFATVVTKNHVITIGGSSGGASTGVYIASITAGVLGTFSATTSLPMASAFNQAWITKDRLYVQIGHNGSTRVTNVYYIAINTDGTLDSTWYAGPSIPLGLAPSTSIVTSSRVYLLSGYNNSAYSPTVYYAPIDEDGIVGAWQTDTSLPGALMASQGIVTDGFAHMMGGQDSSGAYTATIYSAPVDEDGIIGTWVTGTSLPETRAYAEAVMTESRVFMLGGAPGRGTSVITAPITAGALGTWAAGTNLSTYRSHGQALVTDGYIYYLGGNNGSVYTSAILYTTFADGWEITENEYIQ